MKTVFLVSTRNTGTRSMRKCPAQASTVVGNVGRELSLLKMVINMANADCLSFYSMEWTGALLPTAGSGVPSWQQPLRVDGPKASQHSIIIYEIHFCTDPTKTHREVRFWFDLSYDSTRVHRRLLRIKFCCFLYVFCRKVLPRDLVYKMAGPKTRAT